MSRILAYNNVMAKTSKTITWKPVQVKLSDLEHWDDNPVTLSKAQADKLLKSEKKLGKLQTIAISPPVKGKHLLYDGHQRVNVWGAAYGLNTVVWALQSSRLLNDEERHAVPIMTRTATGSLDYEMVAGWDKFDLASFGMDTDWLKSIKADMSGLSGLLESQESETKDAEPQIDKAEQLLKKWKVKTGDLWQIGEHRLICGDCTDAAVVARVTGGEKADAIFTDPPYGVDYEYSEYEDKPENHEAFLESLWKALPPCEMIIMTPGHSHLPWFFEKKPHSIMVWYDKTKQSPSKAAYLNKFDIILVYGKVLTRYKWDVFEVQGVRGDGLRELHTCPKPVELFEKLIGEQNDAVVIYDPFSGSGTTLVACENLGRRGRAIEISPAYCAVTLQRMFDAFGIKGEKIK